MGLLFKLFILVLIGSAAYSYLTLPKVSQLETCFTTTMNKVELCPKSPHYVRLSQISPHIRNAIIISEDTGFYSHKGFDFHELKSSLEKNLKKMSFARGGSTITQQLAKNLFLTSDKTIIRKMKEFILTYRIESRYSKNVILEKYLNVIEFGKDIYGVKAASEYYFQKPPSMIGPLEAAFLAFLLPNPTKYSVSFKNKELTPFARSRIQDILFKMNHYKKILPDEYTAARAQLQVMFKSIPEMDGESEDFEYYSDTMESTYDMTELQQKQEESLNKLNTLDEPDIVYPDEIPESGVYDLEQ